MKSNDASPTLRKGERHTESKFATPISKMVGEFLSLESGA